MVPAGVERTNVATLTGPTLSAAPGTSGSGAPGTPRYRSACRVACRRRHRRGRPRLRHFPPRRRPRGRRRDRLVAADADAEQVLRVGVVGQLLGGELVAAL